MAPLAHFGDLCKLNCSENSYLQNSAVFRGPRFNRPRATMVTVVAGRGDGEVSEGKGVARILGGEGGVEDASLIVMAFSLALKMQAGKGRERKRRGEEDG
ncbi:hypothetical protein E2C01_027056 [Portunus trituberculatus]|uniref:Uncharacterized protein n=1 Tax=Portunus trituberculatus TaxID=210409 RepID=A0A5B7EKI9_PORTR|nr:hypothetical protein [Portunus trituberculatus]